MKKEKSQAELAFDRFVEETKAREKELFDRHQEALKAIDKQERELQQMQQNLNEGERQILQNMEAERDQLQDKIEDLELRREAELELMDEKIKKSGKGFNESLDKEKEYDKRIEKLKAELRPQLKKMELLIKKAALQVKKGEMKYLEKLQIHRMGLNMFRGNLEFFYKSKLNDLQRVFSNPGGAESAAIGISVKQDEINKLLDEIFELEGGADTKEKRIKLAGKKEFPVMQARGKIITMRDLGDKNGGK